MKGKLQIMNVITLEIPTGKTFFRMIIDKNENTKENNDIRSNQLYQKFYIIKRLSSQLFQEISLLFSTEIFVKNNYLCLWYTFLIFIIRRSLF